MLLIKIEFNEIINGRFYLATELVLALLNKLALALSTSNFLLVTLIVFRRQYALTYLEHDDDSFISVSFTSALLSILKDRMYF